MKLRNKKTGKIYKLSDDIYIEYTQGGRIEVRTIIPAGNMSYYYDSLDKLNEDWEDVKEPFVEGKSQRAVLRAAARLSGTDVATVLRSDIAGIVVFDFRGQCRVELKDRGINIKNCGAYTITELCGEEEECEN